MTDRGRAEVADLFSIGGVSIEDDIAQFPESKFYCCQEKNLVIFKSNPTRSEWYKFLNLVLDVAEHFCHAKELYTIGGMVSLGAHTAPRELLAIANSSEMKKVLSQYNLASDMDYETPPGQRPTLKLFSSMGCKKEKHCRGKPLPLGANTLLSGGN